MKVVAYKYTGDNNPKIVVEDEHGSLYIMGKADGFTSKHGSPVSVSALVSKYGFEELDKPVEFSTDIDVTEDGVR